MRPIEFMVDGDPKAQPRPRAFSRNGHARVYDPGSAEGWKSQIAIAARAHRPVGPLEIPICLSVTFFFRRPQSHYGTGRNRSTLKPSAPNEHTSKPDLDNCIKAVKDCLTGLGFWFDDAQVVASHTAKLWTCDRPGAVVRIEDARKPVPAPPLTADVEE